MAQLTMNFQTDSEQDGEMMTSLLPEGFHASHTALQEKDLVQQMIAISGQKCLESFETFNQHGSWAKTFSALLIGTGDWYSTRCKLTWKLKGTKFNRMYFQLQVSTLPTRETGSGLLPTVQTQGLKKCNNEGKTEFVDIGLLPTPVCMDTNCWDLDKIDQRRNRARETSRNGNGFGTTLGELANRGLLPTPRANKVNGCDLMSENLANRNKGNLEEVVAKALQSQMLPTPTADDNPAKNTGRRNQDGLQKRAYQMTGKTSQLNPLFVSEMMGFPPDWLILPFLDGEMSQ